MNYVRFSGGSYQGKMWISHELCEIFWWILPTEDVNKPWTMWDFLSPIFLLVRGEKEIQSLWTQPFFCFWQPQKSNSGSTISKRDTQKPITILKSLGKLYDQIGPLFFAVMSPSGTKLDLKNR